jgi:hypothetical protein
MDDSELNALWSGYRRLKSAAIPDAERTSELGDQPGVDGDDLVHVRVEGH